MISVHGTTTRGDLELSIALDLEPGLTLVGGPNGAGKTTLLRVLAGLDALDTGILHLDHADGGRQVLDAPADGVFVPAHRRPVVMAFQDHRLFPHLNVLDNVAFPARRRGMNRSEAREQAATHLAAVGITDLASRRPARLSIGQQQRTAVARALATPADVLLLDEPLAAIDAEGRAEIRDHLRTAPRRHTLWVTHDADELRRAEALVSLHDGWARQTVPS